MRQSGEATGRLDRRKARTRAALIHAAQAFLAAGTANVPIVEITEAADVGMGSFYNHFDSKDELFRAAVDDALDVFGALLDELSGCLDDPAHAFAQSFRLFGRLHRQNPELSKVLLNDAPAVTRSGRGLAPRQRRDIEAGVRAGRFNVRDPELSHAVVTGAALGLGHLLHTRPDTRRRRRHRSGDRRRPPHAGHSGRRGARDLPAAPPRPRPHASTRLCGVTCPRDLRRRGLTRHCQRHPPGRPDQPDVPALERPGPVRPATPRRDRPLRRDGPFVLVVYRQPQREAASSGSPQREATRPARQIRCSASGSSGSA